MKKFFILFFILVLLNSSVFAMGAGMRYRYVDRGRIFANVTVPKSLPVASHIDENKVEDTTAPIPVSYEAKNGMVDIRRLRAATSSNYNILGIVEIGDGGVFAAVRDGRMRTIHYVDSTHQKVWIPIVFFPIYASRHITTVYGE